MSIGQTKEVFSALSGYNWTSQSEKVDSCANALYERWQREGHDDDLALLQWSKFIRFDKHSDLPGKKLILHQYDSLFPDLALDSDLYAIRSIMSGIVFRGSYNPAGLDEFKKAIAIFKKQISDHPMPYIISRCYQANSLATLTMFDECIGSTDSLVTFCESQEGISKNILSHVYKVNGQLHAYLGNIQLANDRYTQAIDVTRKLLPKNSAYITLLEGNQCECLTWLMFFKKSEDCFGQLFDKIKTLHVDIPKIDLAGLYYAASAPMSFTGNFNQQEDYLLHAIELSKGLNQKMLSSYAYDALAGCARSQGDYSKALNFSQRSIDELTDEQGNLNPFGYSSLYTYAHYASEYGELTVADSLFNVCMQHADDWFLRSDNFSVDYFNLVSWYGDHLNRCAKLDESKKITQDLYNYTQSFNNISPSWLTYLEYNVIEDLTIEKKHTKALSEINRVFKSLYVGTHFPTSGTPHPDSLVVVDDMFKLYYLYLENNYRLFLKEGIQDVTTLANEADKLLGILREKKIHGSVNSEEYTVKTEQTHIFILELYQSLYNFTNDGRYIDKMLQLSNELKSGTNEYLIQHAKTQSSDTTLQTLRQLLESHEYVEYELGEMNDQSLHLKLLRIKDSLQTSIVNARKILYNKLDDQNPILTSKKIRQALEENEVVLDYYFDDKFVHVVFISPDTVFNIFWQSDHFIGKLIENHHTAQKNLEPTDEMASQLHGALFKPIESHLVSKNLIVVPYAQMFYLNFESLRENKHSEYLINQYTFRQIQRLGDLIKKPHQLNAGQYNIQAFTPTFTTELISSYKNHTDLDDQDQEYINLSPLTHISKKLQKLGQSINLMFFEDKQAEERTYFKHSPKAGVIHLASHAVLDNLNPTNSHIFFTKLVESSDQSNDGRLYLSEISNQQLKAKLAILTACNTGRGGIAFGGGPNTLSSSFHLAGVPSIIHTLWSVDEFATADIISNFYLHVKDGLSTSSALRQAKLDFIAQAPLELQHPYYWSGIVLIGEDSHLTFDTPTNWLLWLCLGLFALGFLWLIRSTLGAKSSA